MTLEIEASRAEPAGQAAWFEKPQAKKVAKIFKKINSFCRFISYFKLSNIFLY
jgi:hypothetical protein